MRQGVRDRDKVIAGLKNTITLWEQRFRIISKKYDEVLQQYKYAMKQLADCEAHNDALKKDMDTAIGLARAIVVSSLTPSITPRMFQVTSWRHKFPWLGQWLGRYVPGQPFASQAGEDEDPRMKETDPIPFRRWAFGTEPPDPAGSNWGLPDFFMDSVDKWREIGSDHPAKPHFQHLALMFREIFGRISGEARKVGSLVGFLLTRREGTENGR